LKTSWLAAAGVTLVLALWMASGLLRGENDTDEVSAEATDEELMRVEVIVAEPTLAQRTVEVRGTVAAVRRVELRAETAGRVLELPVERGRRVVTGAPLVRLDTGVRSASLNAARARSTSARAEQTAAESLSRRGLQAQLQTDQARASASLAQAEVDRLQREIDDATVRAPFGARVERLPVELGQLVERGDPVALLVDDSGFEVHARVAQQSVHRLEPGQPVTITLLDGESLTGVLSWIGSVADTATRSFPIEARIAPPHDALADGISATVAIAVERVEALYLSPSTLSLDTDGALGVKVLDDEDRVRFVPVELLRTSLDGAWATGIAPGSRVITLGQGFVGAGERVLPTVAGAAPATPAAAAAIPE